MLGIPPPLTSAEKAGHATFMSELPSRLKKEKLENFTQFFYRRLGFQPTSHRAGRYGIDQSSSEYLSQLGYKVDSSVAPLMDYHEIGGPDFRAHTADPFWLKNEEF